MKSTTIQNRNYGLSGLIGSEYDEFLGIGKKAKKRKKEKRFHKKEKKRLRRERKELKNDERRANTEATRSETKLSQQILQSTPSQQVQVSPQIVNPIQQNSQPQTNTNLASFGSGNILGDPNNLNTSLLAGNTPLILGVLALGGIAYLGLR